jgi:hypothetical protein
VKGEDTTTTTQVRVLRVSDSQREQKGLCSVQRRRDQVKAAERLWAAKDSAGQRPYSDTYLFPVNYSSPCILFYELQFNFQQGNHKEIIYLGIQIREN